MLSVSNDIELARLYPARSSERPGDHPKAPDAEKDLLRIQTARSQQPAATAPHLAKIKATTPPPMHRGSKRSGGNGCSRHLGSTDP